jgi:hypothetical protein
VVYAALSASVALLYCYLQHICVVGQQAGQRPRNLCGICNTFGIRAQFVLVFTIRVGVPQNEGTIYVVYPTLSASVLNLYWFLQYTWGGPKIEGGRVYINKKQR